MIRRTVIGFGFACLLAAGIPATASGQVDVTVYRTTVNGVAGSTFNPGDMLAVGFNWSYVNPDPMVRGGVQIQWGWLDADGNSLGSSSLVKGVAPESQDNGSITDEYQVPDGYDGQYIQFWCQITGIAGFNGFDEDCAEFDLDQGGA